jgi:Fur family ferric uptake transcriptional regulator
MSAVKRATPQRKAIHQALASSGRPLSVAEIYGQAKTSLNRLGIATVYRNLRQMQADGEIVAVELPGKAPRWEMAPERHHHHFLCVYCDKLFEVSGCLEDLKRLLPEGCTLEEHDILLRGRCEACTRRAAKAK